MNEIELQALKESEARFRGIVFLSQDAIIVTDTKGKIGYVNPATERVFNRKVGSFIGTDFGLALVDGESTEIDIFRPGKDPGVGDMHVVETEWLNKKAYLITIRDITERKKAEDRQKLLAKLLALLNSESKDIDTISSILTMIKEFTGFDAVGIRLEEGNDYPYYKTNGFPGEFVQAENYLCARDSEGKIVLDDKGKPYLECMCGNVLSGRTDPCKPFFTEGGSFWTNSTTDLLASTTEVDRMARTRNRCNTAGYESVALIPIRSDAHVIGLLQLNDKRRGILTPELIKFFEEVCLSIGVAMSRKQTAEKIQSQLDELKRWQDVMLGREDRVQELKREVNELCRRMGEAVRYASQEDAPADPGAGIKEHK